MVKATAQLQHGDDISVDLQRSAGRLQNAGDHLQQRGFARSVVADDADHLAALHLKADVFQRPELLIFDFPPEQLHNVLLDALDAVIGHEIPH